MPSNWIRMERPPAREGLYAARAETWAECGIVNVRRTCVEPERFCAYDQLGREYQLEEIQDWHGMTWGCPGCGSSDLVGDYPPGEPEKALTFGGGCCACGRKFSGEEYAEAMAVGPLRMPRLQDAEEHDG